MPILFMTSIKCLKAFITLIIIIARPMIITIIKAKYSWAFS